MTRWRIDQFGTVAKHCILLSGWAITIAWGPSACARSPPDSGQESEIVPPRTIEQVLEDRTSFLLGLPGVVGVGQGLCEGRPCIKVFVVRSSPGPEEQLPAELDGYPVMMELTGQIRPRTGDGGALQTPRGR